MLVRGVNDGDEAVAAIAGFLARLGAHTSYLAVPTRPPAEPWVEPPHEDALNRAFQQITARLPRVELIIGFEGTGFGTTGDPAADLLAITAVHPMREDAALALLARAGADRSVLHGLLAAGRLRAVRYREQTFYVPRLGGTAGDSGA